VSAPELIVFDCDGVLVDSEPIACAVVAQSLAALGLAVSETQIAERYIGFSAASMYADLETRHGVTLDEAQRQTISRAVDERLAATVPAMPGAAAVLEALAAAQQRSCVASSGTPVRIRGSLTRAGLWPHFEGRVFSATQVAHGKPAPDLFLFAAAQMGVAPAKCLVVEDSLAGVTAARAAGMRCLGFTGGGHVRAGHALRLLDAGAFATFDEMARLPQLAG
jgi:HAD superfamily hydrolase (TIGR01509 family)